MSKSTRTKSRAQLSRAEIKAYEARRAEEVRRLPLDSAARVDDATTTIALRRTYALTRDEEYSIIRSDLRRLLIILAVLFVVLFVCTLFLR